MGITTTLEQLGSRFAEWHTDTRPGGLHSAIYDEIDNLTSMINGQSTNINSENTKIVTAINRIINGRNNDYNINNIPISPNLASLQNQINNINSFISYQDISLHNNSIKDYIDTIVHDHDSGSVYYDDILNNFLIQDDITTQNDDLNNYKYNGLYRCLTAGIAQTLQNAPSDLNTPFILIVLSAYQSDDDERENKDAIVRQILLRIYDGGNNQTATNGQRIYSRYYAKANNQWSSWSELYGTHNTKPVSMNVEFSTGTQQEYILLTKL